VKSQSARAPGTLRSSPVETQLRHDLRHLVSDQPCAPDLEAIGQRARHRYRQCLALRGTAAAGAAVLAAGGLFAAVHGTGCTTAGAAAGNSADRSGKPGPAPHAETVAYVTGQVKTALADVDNYVLRTDQAQTGPGGDSATNWVDPRTNNDYEILHDSNGKSIAWLSTYLVHRVLTWKTVEADFATRTWFVSVIHAAGPIQGPTAGATSSVMTPAQIKAWLDSGKLTIVGHRDINGHEAIGLRSPWADGYRELWVDFANEKGPMKNVLLIGNETWLPRTRSLLDTVNHVHIPAGFRKVAAPR
jgi:hypothetical protein